MADTELNLNWDTQDGSIVCTLNVGDTDVELGSLTIDREELFEAFAEDFQEADMTDNPDSLLEWELLAETFADMSSVIDSAVEALRLKRAVYRKHIIDNGVDWT